MQRRFLRLIVLCAAAASVPTAAALGEEQAARLQASHYHFIVDFSRDQLAITEMLARPEAAEMDDGLSGHRLQMRLPPGAFNFQAGPGVGLTDQDVVIDFAGAGEGQYLTWEYGLPLRPGTMAVERTLPLPIAVASVIVEQAGPELDVAWPRAAEVRPGIAPTGDHLTASARDVPAREALTITLLKVPPLTESASRTWLLWVVVAMATATAGAVIAGPRRN